MTTIVIRDSVVAFDSKVSETDFTLRHVKALKAVVSDKHKAIFAGAGWSSAIHVCMQRLEEMKTLPWRRKRTARIDTGIRDEDTEVVVLDEISGSVYFVDREGWWPFSEPFYAAGSGKDAALAAMHMGADAKRAVEIACLVDNGSGPPIHCIHSRKIL